MKYFFFLSLFFMFNSFLDENFKKKEYEFSEVPDREEALTGFQNPNGKLPDYFDYSNYIGSPKDQGSKCGSCSIFSFITQVETLYSFKYNRKYTFSEQEFLDCTDVTCNDGISFGKIKEIMRKRNYLAHTYDNYDGIKDKSRCKKIEENLSNKYSSTTKLKINEMGVKSFKYGNTRCIKSLLIEYGPLGSGIHHSLLENYKSGSIIKYNTSDCQNKDPDHAVTIMGYNKDENGNLYWIVRNSYGTNFGENGYFRILAGSNICNIEAKLTYVNISWNSWCGEGCDSCSYNDYSKKLVCNSCIDGYIYGLETHYCYKCPQGCKYCNTPYSCKTCNDGYYLLGSLCQKCAKNCKVCQDSINCKEWYLGTMEEDETFIDDILNGKECACFSKFLGINIFILFLHLLI